MLIGIDANEANLNGPESGENQYAFELLEALYASKTKQQVCNLSQKLLCNDYHY